MGVQYGYVYLSLYSNGTSGCEFPPPPTNPLNKLIRSFANITLYQFEFQFDIVSI
jgi:hypothetical protein